MPMYTDLHHMYPTDGFVNNKRDNHPFGETNGDKYKSANDFSKLGSCTFEGYSGIVFEPNDESFDRFSFSETKEELCVRERLNPDIPIVLMMAGSFGVTGVLDFYTQLAQSTRDLQIIVITGRNIRLFDHLDKKIQELNTSKNTKLLYFVDNVEDYMHIADLIVTKPGGLTVTESIACHLPMAIYSAFPGQEEDNVTFLLEQNAAVLVDKKNGAQEILDLLHSPEKLAAMKESCKRLALPNAAEDIFNLAKQLCGKE